MEHIRKLEKHETLVIRKELGTTPTEIVLFFLALLLKQNSSYGVFYEGKQWLRNTHQSLADKIGASVSTVQRALNKLIAANIILKTHFESGRKYYGGKNVCYFTIDFDHLIQFIYKNSSFPKSQISSTDVHVKLTEQLGQFDRSISYKQSLNIKITDTDYARLGKKNKNSSEDQSQENLTSSLVMFNLWNDIIQTKLQKQGMGEIITLTQKRSIFLNKALQQCFDGDIKKWESFCNYIANNDFLMGGGDRKFYVKLDWALQFDKIDKIKNGFYNRRDSFDGDNSSTSKSSTSIQNNEFISQRKANIPVALPAQEIKIREQMCKMLGDDLYVVWAQNTRILFEGEGRKPILIVESYFLKSRFETNFKLRDVLELFFDSVQVGDVINPIIENAVNIDTEYFRDNEISVIENRLDNSTNLCIDEEVHILKDDLVDVNIENVHNMNNVCLNDEDYFCEFDNKLPNCELNEFKDNLAHVDDMSYIFHKTPLDDISTKKIDETYKNNLTKKIVSLKLNSLETENICFNLCLMFVVLKNARIKKNISFILHSILRKKLLYEHFVYRQCLWQVFLNNKKYEKYYKQLRESGG